MALGQKPDPFVDLWFDLRYAAPSAGGGTSCNAVDTSQGQASDAAALTQHHVISVADTSQGQASDTAALTQHHSISVADTSQGQASDTTSVTEHTSAGPGVRYH
jgi:hypothetical protein